VLHLLCQGIEIVLKSLLLFTDYDAHTKLSAHQRGGAEEKQRRSRIHGASQAGVMAGGHCARRLGTARGNRTVTLPLRKPVVE
jgi:hypothetical protein